MRISITGLTARPLARTPIEVYLHIAIVTDDATAPRSRTCKRATARGSDARQVRGGGPDATGLVVAGKPYRIRLDGTNFQTGLSAFVGTDSTPWPSVKYKSATRLILKGSALKSRFPRGEIVQIRVVNPDTGSDTIQFTR